MPGSVKKIFLYGLIKAKKVLKSSSTVKSLEQWKGLEAVAEIILEARAAKGRFCKVKPDDIRSCMRVARMIRR